MNEPEEYDGATLEKAIHVLDNEILIRDINKIAEDNNCKISICHHKDDQKRDRIYFCAELIDANKTPNTVKIGACIYELTHYYEKISVNLKSDYSPQDFPRLFENVTLFTPENYHNIHEFFKKYYPEYYSASSQNVAHQDKRPRSVVSPPRSPSMFSQSGNHPQQESKLPTPQMVVEYLEKAPWWNELRATSPEKANAVIDQACGRAKRVLEQTSSSRPTSSI